MLVFLNTSHHSAGQPVLLVVVLKSTRSRIKFAQTVLRSDPHRTLMIEMNRIYAIVAQRPGIVRVVLVDSELSCPRVEAVQPRIRSKPKEPCAVLLDFLIVNGILVLRR